MDKITKKPFAKFPVYINFAPDLDSGEAVVAYTVLCVNTATQQDSKANIVHADSLTSPKVYIVLKGGGIGETHRLTIKATTDYDNVFEKEVFVLITDPRTGSFDKRALDEFTIAANFSNDLETGEVITSKWVTATKLADGSDATLTVIEGSIVDGNKVLVGVMGGLVRSAYKLTVQIVTSNTFQYQQDIVMRVP